MTKLVGASNKINAAAVTVAGNSFSGLFTHANTADRTYTFQDKAGTVAFVSDVNKTGFPNRTSTTLTFNTGTRVVTLAPTGSNFTVSVNGVIYTKTTQTTTIPNTTGGYFVYFDNTGTFQQSTTPWDILTTAPVAYVYWDATLGDGFCFEERHGDVMDPSSHYYLHFVNGTEILSGFTASGYDLAGNGGNATNAFNTFAIASGVVADEDINYTLSALPDNGPYTIFTRTGATGTWTWTKNNTIPFKVGTTFPQYNQWTGATWQMTEGASLRYINYFVYVAPSIDTLFQYIIIPGQQIHTSLAAAQAETYGSLSLGTLPFQEIAPLYQVTLRTGAGVAYNGATGSCRIEAFARIIGTKSSIGSFQPSVHNSLTGLQGGIAGEYFHLEAIQQGMFTTGTTNLALGASGYITSSAGVSTGILTLSKTTNPAIDMIEGGFNRSKIWLSSGDLYISSFNASGTFIDDAIRLPNTVGGVFSVRRPTLISNTTNSTGATTQASIKTTGGLSVALDTYIGGNITAVSGTFTGDTTIGSPTGGSRLLNIDAAPGSISFVTWKKGGNYRAAISVNSITEGGSDTGSTMDFAVYRDNGTAENFLSVPRAAGSTITWNAARPISMGALTVTSLTTNTIDSSGATLGIGGTTATTINLGVNSSSNTINIGTGAGATTINLGGAGDTVNIAGTLAYVNTTNLTITDKLITLNKGGAAASGALAGIEVEENGAITGYIKLLNRDIWGFSVPNRLGYTTITPPTAAWGAALGFSTITADRSYSFPDATGTLALRGEVTNGWNDNNLYYEKAFAVGTFPDGVANQAFDIRLGNIIFVGYIEVELTSNYANVNGVGKITKVFSFGANANNSIFENVSRVVDALGSAATNFAIGDISWDATNTTYRIPISHIVTGGNPVYVKIRALGGSTGVISNLVGGLSVSTIYTLTALSANYVNYINSVGVGAGANQIYLSSTNGYVYASALSNYSSNANALFAAGNNGAVISRNIADANSALIVNQIHASSTGNILDLQFSGVTKASVDLYGSATFKGSTVLHNYGTALTATQQSMSSWAYGGDIIGTASASSYSGLAIGGTYRAANAVASFISFHNFNINDTLANTAGAYIYAYSTDATAGNRGMDLSFRTSTGTSSPTETLRLSTNGSTVYSTLTAGGTYGFTMGPLTGSQRIVYGVATSTAFGFLTASNTYADIYASAAVFSGTVGISGVLTVPTFTVSHTAPLSYFIDTSGTYAYTGIALRQSTQAGDGFNLVMNASKNLVFTRRVSTVNTDVFTIANATGAADFLGNSVAMGSTTIATSASYDALRITSNATPGNGTTVESLNVARTGYIPVTLYANAWRFHNGTSQVASISSAGALSATGAAFSSTVTLTNNDALLLLKGGGSSNGLLIQSAPTKGGYFWNYENAEIGFASNNTMRLTISATGVFDFKTNNITNAGSITAGNNLWVYGLNSNAANQELIRARGIGYSQTTYTGIQVGKTGDHIALFIDPSTITGGSFNGSTSEILLPNAVYCLQANAGGTDWRTGFTLIDGTLTAPAISGSTLTSTLASGGAAPLVVASTTPIYNLSTHRMAFVDGANPIAGTVIPAFDRATEPAPNAYQRSVVYEFKNKTAITGLPGFTGNYIGLLTMAPYVGTTAGGGGTNHQLAFFGNTTTDATMCFRTGIDTTWNAWNTILHSGNVTTWTGDIGGGGRISHAESYSVATATYVPINLYTGTSTLAATKAYRIELVTGPTGTSSGAVYIVYQLTSTPTFGIKLVSNNGNTSNHPLARLSVDGTKIEIYHNHPSTYTINTIVTTISTGNNTVTAPSLFGLESSLTRQITELSTTDNFTAATLTSTGSVNSTTGVYSASWITAKTNPDTSGVSLALPNGHSRWLFMTSGADADAGADTGSILSVARCHDSGTFWDSVFSINRNTGNASFAYNLSSTGYGTFNGITIGADPAQASIFTNAANGLQIRPKTGSTYDYVLLNSADNAVVHAVPTGTTRSLFLGANQTNATNLCQVSIWSTNTATQDMGGTLGLGGYYTGTASNANFASLRGGKENATDGNYAGYLSLSTVANGGVLAEHMRIGSDGTTVIYGTTKGYLTLNSSATTVLSGAIVGQVDVYTNDASSITNRVVASIQAIAEQDYVGTDQASTKISFLTHGTSGAATEKVRVQGDGGFNIGNIDTTYVATLTTTAITQVAIMSIPVASYCSVRFLIQGREGTKFHTCEMLAISNGATSDCTEYAALNLGGLTGAFTVDFNGGNLRLLVTPASTASTTFKVSATCITA